jgi:2-keto-3-deoxy-L-rhamnonate aldolase RhmA
MALILLYITNNEDVAQIAQSAGVDRIFIDMEYIGKDLRQGGMDTVQNHHTIYDIVNIRKHLNKSKLLVRINPIHNKTFDYESTEDEINRTIDAGADIIMLPMYKTISDVERFLKVIDGRVRTLLLSETPEACQIMDDTLKIKEVDEIHIGLNDLHLALKKKFMFQLLADGTVDMLANKIKKSGKVFGFGGIARLGYGSLPAERIIIEHYRLGSKMAILSRSFCNVDKINELDIIQKIFAEEVTKIREAEEIFKTYTPEQFEENHRIVKDLVNQIVEHL